MDPQPVTLGGRWVRLEPLADRHLPGLLVAAQDDRIWEWMPTRLRTDTDLRVWLDTALEAQSRGEELPFAVREQGTEALLGSTRYMDIKRPHRGLEIGWTWLNPRVWRTAINTECKYLLLSHAFETLDALRVQFKTDLLNTRSQTAIARLGARREGVLRQDRIVREGRVRDTVYSSILRDEWPAIRTRMQVELYDHP